jgi:hypothetical protein
MDRTVLFLEEKIDPIYPVKRVKWLPRIRYFIIELYGSVLVNQVEFLKDFKKLIKSLGFFIVKLYIYDQALIQIQLRVLAEE